MYVPEVHDARLDVGQLYRESFTETHYPFDHRGCTLSRWITCFWLSLDQITLKKGEPVILRLHSEDVTHGFFIRKLKMDTDIEAGKTTDVAITPDTPGTNTTICDHFCGANHGNMKRAIVVEWAMSSSGSRQAKGLMVAVLAVIACPGCQVRQPGRVETPFAEQIKRTVTVGGKKDVNPIPAHSENIQAGQKNFAYYCLVCNGLDGQNTGVPFADRMSPSVPALNSEAAQKYSNGQPEMDHRLRDCALGNASIQGHFGR